MGIKARGYSVEVRKERRYWVATASHDKSAKVYISRGITEERAVVGLVEQIVEGV